MASREVATSEPIEEAVQGQERSAWEGFDVTQAEIDWLCRSRQIPADVQCQLSCPKLSLLLNPGEYVIRLKRIYNF
jgi:hypothetical protein